MKSIQENEEQRLDVLVKKLTEEQQFNLYWQLYCSKDPYIIARELCGATIVINEAQAHIIDVKAWRNDTDGRQNSVGQYNSGSVYIFPTKQYKSEGRGPYHILGITTPSKDYPNGLVTLNKILIDGTEVPASRIFESLGIIEALANHETFFVKGKRELHLPNSTIQAAVVQYDIQAGVAEGYKISKRFFH